MYRTLYTKEQRPKFCTKCRLEVITTTLSVGYDAYTGKETYKEFMACPSAIKTLLDTHHDVWELMDGETFTGLGLQTVSGSVPKDQVSKQ